MLRKSSYFFIVSWVAITCLTNVLEAVQQFKSPEEKLSAYFKMRKEKEYIYAEKFPHDSDMARYTQYLQDMYPYCKPNAIEQMVAEDVQNAQKLLMDIWQIGGSDWYKFNSMVTPPPPLPFRLPYLTIKHRIAVAITCIGIPLIIGGTYKITQLIKKRYKKRSIDKEAAIATS